MESKLLNPLAIDSKGNFVSIENAQKGQDYYCPKCKEQLTFRKQGTGPHAHRNHFSHKVNSDCHGLSETEIHRTAKEGIYEILLSAIEKHRDFPIAWTCPECGMLFKANLLKRASAVKMELDMGKAKPDIALLDENGEVIVAVEVVFTHEPEPETMAFYNENNIVVVRLDFHSIEECNFLSLKLTYPTSVNVCFKHNCPSCQSMPFPRFIHPLLNADEKYYAVAVAINTPFEEQPFWGLPFSEQDKINAQAYVNEHFSGIQLNYIERLGVHCATFARKPVTITRPHRYVRYGGSPIDYIDSRMDHPQKPRRYTSNKGNHKTSSAKKSYGGKKTGGKRRH